MTWVDLTTRFPERTPTWEDAELYRSETVCEIADDSPVRVSRISMSSHNGTHVDAPSHFLPGGRMVEDLTLEDLAGPAWICETGDAQLLDAELLEGLSIPRDAKRILFKTANSRRRLMDLPSFQRDYAGLDLNGAGWLLERGMRLVGMDYLSIQAYQASDETHRRLLREGTILVEGLVLHGVSTGWWDLVCLPLLASDLDGAPARVIARPIP